MITGECTEISYVYALSAQGGDIRYIGKANDPKRRLAQHITACKTRKPQNMTPRDVWLHSIIQEGRRPILSILQIGPRSKIYKIEKSWIAKKRFECDLVNDDCVKGISPKKRIPLDEEERSIGVLCNGKSLNVSQAAKFAGVSTTMIYTALSSGAIPYVTDIPCVCANQSDVLFWMIRAKSKGGRPRGRKSSIPAQETSE